MGLWAVGATTLCFPDWWLLQGNLGGEASCTVQGDFLGTEPPSTMGIRLSMLHGVKVWGSTSREF